jgi:PEGA domain
VYIDGKYVGLTPMRGSSLSPGSHAVRVELAGYRTVTTKADVHAGAETAITLTLEQAAPEVASPHRPFGDGPPPAARRPGQP